MNRKKPAKRDTRVLTRTGVIRIHHSHNGIAAIADISGSPFRGAFKVGLAGRDEAFVRVGTINERFPLIKSIPISGVVDGKQVTVPSLKLTGGPNEDLCSWVGVRVKVDMKSERLEEVPEALQMIHVNSLKDRFQNGVGIDDGKGVGFLPVAMILWQDKSTAYRVIQDVYFNQRHVFKSAEKAKAWHIFSPAV